MKKNVVFLALLLGIASCRSGKHGPDISGVHIELKLERFDQAFFSMDTTNMQRSLFTLNQRFPYFTNDFMVNILGTTPLSDTSLIAFRAARIFLTSYLPVKDSIEHEFKNVDWLEKELRSSFAHIKYYFPNYQMPPKVVSFIGPFDAPAAALTRFTLAIGLQLYAGKDFSFYKSAQGQELYPAYVSRRFEPQYINTNCMKAIAEDLFPDTSGGRPLIEQIIEKGKYWWLVNQFIPDAEDSLITGFTESQLKWCKENEGQIWNIFLQTDIFTIDQGLVKNFLGESPRTQGMPDSSPGNIGQWVGWQIVKKYFEKNPSISPKELMQTNSRTIFDAAKYKPK